MDFAPYNDPNQPIDPNDHYTYIRDNVVDNGCLLYKVNYAYILNNLTIVDNVVFVVVDTVLAYVDIAVVVVGVCYLDDTGHLFLSLYSDCRGLDQQRTNC